MNKKRISILAVIATGVATLSGCGLNQPAPEMKYHLLDNQKVAMNHKLPVTKVAIAKVKLSDYLLQPNLVMRVQDNQLDVANYHSWAEPLDKAVQRILIDNLNQKRSETGFVDRCQNCSQVHVFIDHFYPDEAGQVSLSGRFTINNPEQSPQVEYFSFAQEQVGSGYKGSVVVMNQLLTQLSDKINSGLK